MGFSSKTFLPVFSDPPKKRVQMSWFHQALNETGCQLLVTNRFFNDGHKVLCGFGGIRFSGAGLLLTFMVCLGSTQLTQQNFLYKNDEARPRAKKKKHRGI